MAVLAFASRQFAPKIVDLSLSASLFRILSTARGAKRLLHIYTKYVRCGALLNHGSTNLPEITIT